MKTVIRLDAEIDGHQWTQLACLVDGKYVASVEVHHVGKKSAHITKLYISPEKRRLHIGSDLLATCEEIAFRSRCETIALMIHPGNTDIAPFYRKNGYTLAFEHQDGEQMWSKTL